MSTHRNIDKICLVVLVLTLLLTVAFMNGETLGLEAVPDEDAETYAGTAYFTKNDLDGTWEDNAFTTRIALNGDTASVSGSGAYAYDGGVVITNGGWYVLSGTLTDGSITVDAHNSSKVWIRLEGVDVACSDDACLIVDQAEKVFLTLAEGSENMFSSGADYSDNALSDNTGGAIFAHDDLTINGSGSLTVTAAYKHGIDANDSLVITGGRISVTAPMDGIHVNDDFRFREAELTVSAGDDAVHADASIYVESGTIQIPQCYEGLEAVTVDVAGGDIVIYPDDDGINANGGSGMMGMGSAQPNGGMTPPDQGDGAGSAAEGGAAAQQTADEGSGETETWFRITGGSVTIVNENGRDADGIDSNGSVYIDGGTVRVSLPGDSGNNAIDYGSESGGELIVTGGSVIACGDSSMVEAFSADSTQCAVLLNPGTTAMAGTVFRVLDGSGSELLSCEPPCSYSSVAFSAPSLALGQTYTVCIGDETQELTLSETATLVGTASGGMGNPNGGMQPGGEMNGPEGMPPTEQGGDAASEMSERPTPPGGMPGNGSGDTSERPTPPEGFGGSTGDTSERPTPPGGFGGGSGDTSERPTPPGGFGDFAGAGSDTAQSASDTATEGTTAGTDVGMETWLLLGVCALVLAAAIVFAAKYRRYG